MSRRHSDEDPGVDLFRYARVGRCREHHDAIDVAELSDERRLSPPLRLAGVVRPVGAPESEAPRVHAGRQRPAGELAARGGGGRAPGLPRGRPHVPERRGHRHHLQGQPRPRVLRKPAAGDPRRYPALNPCERDGRQQHRQPADETARLSGPGVPRRGMVEVPQGRRAAMVADRGRRPVARGGSGGAHRTAPPRRSRRDVLGTARRART